MIKCIHIDVDKGTVNYVEIDEDDVQQYYKLIGCTCMEVAYVRLLEPYDVVYVDEEGLLKGPVNYFWLKGHQQPFAGSGLIVGTNEEGVSCDVTTDIHRIRRNIFFSVTGV